MPLPGAISDPTRITADSVRVPSDHASVDGYLARPTMVPGPRPGIVVVHEAFGPVDHIHDIARRLANQGFDTLAPNLYTRMGAPDPNDMTSVLPAMFALPDSGAIADLEAAARFLRSLDSSNGKLGCIGFCSGGRQTLLFACSSPALNAAVDCWGGFIDRASPDHITTPARPAPVIELAKQLTCPLFAAGGAEDDNPSPETLADLEARLTKAGKDATIKVYPDAGHAFLADYRPSYRDGPAHELWADIITFFDRHLRA